MITQIKYRNANDYEIVVAAVNSNKFTYTPVRTNFQRILLY